MKSAVGDGRRPADEGMTLVEVVVAITLFAVMAGSILALLAGAIRLTRDDRFHMEASILASRELEITRDAFASGVRGPTTIDVNQAVNPSPLAGGTAGQPLVVDNVPYTVTRTAQWSEMGQTAASTCDEGGSIELAYLRVQVDVSWPGLGDRPPVTMSTVMTPPKGTYSALTGHIGVKVIDASGAPFGGRTVTATGASGTYTETTSDDGCALFAFLAPGTYQVKVQSVGYVNRNGDPAGTATAQVQVGQLWRTTIEYDQAAALTATFTTASGYALPTTNAIPIALGNSALLPSGSKSVAGSGNTRTVANLWPYPSGYQVWAGSCLDNDPQFTDQDRGLPITTDPGTTVPVNVPLGAIDVQGPANAAITAVHAADSACASGLTITLGTTAASGKLKTSVPFGTWTIKSGTKTASVTVASGDSPRSVNLP
ncbi:hypothetical protein ASC77_19250 [Nocardioides sp. Root1257]|uniref:carboxypeptidase regulatory-like domain-containing protein n=1 Tax=unclassified Nocardioides TaxID=2615069 RepID=UPI0006F5FED6|nr:MULTISPECIES: carboxypeptidase regulatory-like domain-containing protein [unclassified Nocardioides]KQW46036.1 hypothetical protein ASC77_19250 [Nocardioides sp. Root1257]KRC43299.1 hypothetical protein ASE24_20215 [Nocardioides sp. Root224]